MNSSISRLPIATISRQIVSLTARIWHADKAGGGLPLLHRLAIIYLMVPLIIWLVGWFHWWFGIPAAVLIILAFRPALSGPLRLSLPRSMTFAILLLAAVWMMSTAAGGVFDATNADWNKHRWILLNLGYYPWPTFIPDFLAPYLSPEFHSPFLLRYYLGWYIVPGSFARLLGSDVLNWAVPLWTWLGIALILLLFVRERRGWSVIFAAVIFIFFGGMDFLRLILQDNIDAFGFHTTWTGPREIGIHYLTTMRSMQWVPQHVIPAGLYTFLLLQLRRQPRFLRVSAVLLAAAPFWSAFVAIGLLPFIAALLWKNGFRPFLGWSNLALAPALTGLTAIYLTSGSLDPEQGWIWERHDWPELARLIPTVYLAEFLFLVLLLCVLRPILLRKPFFIAGLATLMLLPLYHYGEWNDLNTRASLPALFILCYYCTDTIFDQAGARLSGAALRWKRLGLAGIAMTLAVGSLSAVTESALNVSKFSVFRYEQGYYTSTLNVAPHKLDQYLVIAHDIPRTLRVLLDTNSFLLREDEDGRLVIPSFGGTNITYVPNLPASFQGFSEDTLATLAAARRIVGTEQEPIFLASGDYDDEWVRFIFPSQSEVQYIRMFNSKRSIIFPADLPGARYLFAFGLPHASIMERYFDGSSAQGVGTLPSGRPITLHRLFDPLPPFEPERLVPARFGDQMHLYGLDLPSDAQAGEAITVRWYWRILADDQRNLAFSNQLFGDDGSRRGQLDDRGFTPNYWPADTTGITTFEIEIDPQTPTGAYWLRVGTYDRGRQDTSNLPVFDAQGNQAGNYLRLGPIKVHGRPPAPSSEGLLPSPPNPDNLLPAAFADQIDLLGYNLSHHRLASGQSLDLTLFWSPRGRPTQGYTVFVHLLDSQGQLRAQTDSPPTSGKYPTSVWDPGEVIADLHTLSLAPDLPAGEYRIAVGLYDPETGQRVQTIDESGTVTADLVMISGLVVEVE